LKVSSPVEDFEGEEFVSELSEEASVLPRFSGLNKAAFDAVGKRHRSELGTVVGDNPIRLSVNEAEPPNLLLHGESRILRRGIQKETFPGEAV
jgi:hypothetical protein